MCVIISDSGFIGGLEIKYTVKQREDLAKSGISTEIAAACGIKNIESDNEISSILGWEAVGLAPALEFSYHMRGDPQRNKISTRLKPDNPRMDSSGKIVKYEQPKNTSTHIYSPPILNQQSLNDVDTPLFFTEGEKKSIALTLNGFSCVAAPGVCNFHDPSLSDKEDGQYVLRSDFDDIPLTGRKCYIVFDKNKSKNPFVLKAELVLAKMLRDRGAEVYIIHLEANKQQEMGVDEFIVENGVEAFKFLIDKAWAYPFSGYIKSLPDDVGYSERKDDYDKVVRYLAVTDDEVEYALLRKAICKVAGVTKGQLDKAIKRVQSQAKNKEKAGLGFLLDDAGPRNQLFAKMLSTLIDKDIFSFGNQLINIFGDRFDTLTEKNFSGIFNNFSEYATNTKDGTKYDLIPSEIAKGFILNPLMRKAFREIVSFVIAPVFDSEFIIAKPGFNESSKIYYFGKEIVPIYLSSGALNHDLNNKKTTTHLSKLLNEFCFKSMADRDNFLGALISRLLPTMFMGECPFLAIVGNQPSLGKSLLGNLIAIIYSGKQSPRVNYNPNDEQFERAITVHARNNDYVFIDNVRGNKIESQFLEGMITSKVYAARILGKTENIERPNTILFMLSMNDASLNKDLITRALPVELYYPDNPSKRKFCILDPAAYAEEHREQLLAELIGFIEVWKAKGKPIKDIDYRFKRYAGIIGGILEANGHSEFLSNADEAAAKFDDTLQEIAYLFEGHLDQVFTAAELVSMAEEKELFRTQLMSKESSKAKATFLGKLLGPYNKRELPIETEDDFRGAIILDIDRNDTHARQAKYSAKRSSDCGHCGHERTSEKLMSAGKNPSNDGGEEQSGGHADFLLPYVGENKNISENKNIFSTYIGGQEMSATSACLQSLTDSNKHQVITTGNNLKWS
ncbi:MAG: DUF3854 domain-containing protein [Oligoflexia bacterium]|nr:DUF3854 domain-containing protein [Oligoflexia bacterium]